MKRSIEISANLNLHDLYFYVTNEDEDTFECTPRSEKVPLG